MLAVTYYLIPSLLLIQLAVGSSVYFNKIFAAQSSCPADADEPWSYRGSNGPMYWGVNHTECNKGEQSPIDIVTSLAELDPKLRELNFNNYDTPVTSANIVNNGHTVQLTPTDNVQRSITIGGSTYTLRQLHFHWGDSYSKGAEHTLDGTQHALEMHLVHLNENKQIAVVGVIFKEQKAVNNELQIFVNSLPEVRYKDTETELKSSLNLNNLLPNNPNSYFRYPGSLTTPGCGEGVTWSVLTNLLTVGKTQMAEFRSLSSAPVDKAVPACTLSNNYRPVQPLNDRKVTMRQ